MENKTTQLNRPVKDLNEFCKFGCELISTMAKALVDHPELVTVDIQMGEHTTVFNLRVGPKDLGHVLGRQGSNAASMRKILLGYAAKSRRRAVLEIVDPAYEGALHKKQAA